MTLSYIVNIIITRIKPVENDYSLCICHTANFSAVYSLEKLCFIKNELVNLFCKAKLIAKSFFKICSLF